MFKILFHAEILDILGVHLIGRAATEVIHIGQIAISFNAKIDYFIDQIFNYPTYLRKIAHNKTQLSKEVIMDILDPILKEHFRPEFLNRLDDILPFLPLRREDMERIVEIQLERVRHLIKGRSVDLTWTKELVKFLAEEGYDPGFGARPLKRLIQQTVLNLLSEILKGRIPE